MKPTYKIEGWGILDNRLIGYVQRYEGNSSKNHAYTSTIIGYHDNMVETKNSIYELGAVAKGYDREELLKRVPKQL